MKESSHGIAKCHIRLNGFTLSLSLQGISSFRHRGNLHKDTFRVN
jgi:hypothetical protein